MTDNKCAHKCPGGHDCCCQADVRHELHICADSRCDCHSAARYHDQLTQLAELGRIEERWRMKWSGKQEANACLTQP